MTASLHIAYRQAHALTAQTVSAALTPEGTYTALTLDVFVLALMALSTFAFVGFIAYKFLSYKSQRDAVRRKLFEDLFKDKYRMN